jgi:hypothetical protein
MAEFLVFHFFAPVRSVRMESETWTLTYCRLTGHDRRGPQGRVGTPHGCPARRLALHWARSETPGKGKGGRKCLGAAHRRPRPSTHIFWQNSGKSYKASGWPEPFGTDSDTLTRRNLPASRSAAPPWLFFMKKCVRLDAVPLPRSWRKSTPYPVSFLPATCGKAHSSRKSCGHR